MWTLLFVYVVLEILLYALLVTVYKQTYKARVFLKSKHSLGLWVADLFMPVILIHISRCLLEGAQFLIENKES